MSNERKTFKAGDLVYSPTEGTQVFTVHDRGIEYLYDLKIRGQTATRCGNILSSQNNPSIFPATKENQVLLEALYGVKFDDPPLSDEEKVIEALKSANGKPVVCWVKFHNSDWYIRSIGSCSGNLFYAQDRTIHYTDAKPLSPDEFVLA